MKIINANFFLMVLFLNITFTSVSILEKGGEVLIRVPEVVGPKIVLVERLERVSPERSRSPEGEFKFKSLVRDIGAKQVDFKKIEIKASEFFPELSEEEQSNLVTYTINLIAFTNALNDPTIHEGEEAYEGIVNIFVNYILNEKKKINRVIEGRD